MSYESSAPCIVCGKHGQGMTCYHHIYTRKAYPEFASNPWNMISVCQQHHNEFHNKGTDYMATTYPSVLKWLQDKGWMRLEYLKKWIKKAGLDGE